MPRIVRDSDEDVETKTVRRTRAAVAAASVTDSPVRRSTRNNSKQLVSVESSPDSIDDGTQSTGRKTRSRTATLEKGAVASVIKNLRSRKNSASSDVSEVVDTETEGTQKRITRKAASAAQAVGTPTKTNLRTRAVRAGSEVKSTPPARNKRVTRASSVDPVGSVNESAGTPVKRRTRASIIPMEPTVAEEQEMATKEQKSSESTVMEIDENNSENSPEAKKENSTEKFSRSAEEEDKVSDNVKESDNDLEKSNLDSSKKIEEGMIVESNTLIETIEELTPKPLLINAINDSLVCNAIEVTDNVKDSNVRTECENETKLDSSHLLNHIEFEFNKQDVVIFNNNSQLADNENENIDVEALSESTLIDESVIEVAAPDKPSVDSLKLEIKDSYVKLDRTEIMQKIIAEKVETKNSNNKDSQLDGSNNLSKNNVIMSVKTAIVLVNDCIKTNESLSVKSDDNKISETVTNIESNSVNSTENLVSIEHDKLEALNITKESKDQIENSKIINEHNQENENSSQKNIEIEDTELKQISGKTGSQSNVNDNNDYLKNSRSIDENNELFNPEITSNQLSNKSNCLNFENNISGKFHHVILINDDSNDTQISLSLDAVSNEENVLNKNNDEFKDPINIDEDSNDTEISLKLEGPTNEENCTNSLNSIKEMEIDVVNDSDNINRDGISLTLDPPENAVDNSNLPNKSNDEVENPFETTYESEMSISLNPIIESLNRETTCEMFCNKNINQTNINDNQITTTCNKNINNFEIFTLSDESNSQPVSNNEKIDEKIEDLMSVVENISKLEVPETSSLFNNQSKDLNSSKETVLEEKSETMPVRDSFVTEICENKNNLEVQNSTDARITKIKTLESLESLESFTSLESNSISENKNNDNCQPVVVNEIGDDRDNEIQSEKLKVDDEICVSTNVSDKPSENDFPSEKSASKDTNSLIKQTNTELNIKKETIPSSVFNENTDSDSQNQLVNETKNSNSVRESTDVVDLAPSISEHNNDMETNQANTEPVNSVRNTDNELNLEQKNAFLSTSDGNAEIQTHNIPNETVFNQQQPLMSEVDKNSLYCAVTDTDGDNTSSPEKVEQIKEDDGTAAVQKKASKKEQKDNKFRRKSKVDDSDSEDMKDLFQDIPAEEMYVDNTSKESMESHKSNISESVKNSSEDSLITVENETNIVSAIKKNNEKTKSNRKSFEIVNADQKTNESVLNRNRKSLEKQRKSISELSEKSLIESKESETEKEQNKSLNRNRRSLSSELNKNESISEKLSSSLDEKSLNKSRKSLNKSTEEKKNERRSLLEPTQDPLEEENENEKDDSLEAMEVDESSDEQNENKIIENKQRRSTSNLQNKCQLDKDLEKISSSLNNSKRLSTNKSLNVSSRKSMENQKKIDSNIEEESDFENQKNPSTDKNQNKNESGTEKLLTSLNNSKRLSIDKSSNASTRKSTEKQKEDDSDVDTESDSESKKNKSMNKSQNKNQSISEKLSGSLSNSIKSNKRLSNQLETSKQGSEEILDQIRKSLDKRETEQIEANVQVEVPIKIKDKPLKESSFRKSSHMSTILIEDSSTDTDSKETKKDKENSLRETSLRKSLNKSLNIRKTAVEESSDGETDGESNKELNKSVDVLNVSTESTKPSKVSSVKFSKSPVNNSTTKNSENEETLTASSPDKSAKLTADSDQSDFNKSIQKSIALMKYQNPTKHDFSTIAQIDSSSGDEDETSMSNSQMNNDSNATWDSDSHSEIDINSDIEKEYNLAGKSPNQTDEEEIPGDDCRASEEEYSDSEDEGSDLDDFVVSDEAVEEEIEGKESAGSEKDEEDEENEDESCDEVDDKVPIQNVKEKSTNNSKLLKDKSMNNSKASTKNASITAKACLSQSSGSESDDEETATEVENKKNLKEKRISNSKLLKDKSLNNSKSIKEKSMNTSKVNNSKSLVHSVVSSSESDDENMIIDVVNKPDKSINNSKLAKDESLNNSKTVKDKSINLSKSIKNRNSISIVQKQFESSESSDDEEQTLKVIKLKKVQNMDIASPSESESESGEDSYRVITTKSVNTSHLHLEPLQNKKGLLIECSTPKSGVSQKNISKDSESFMSKHNLSTTTNKSSRRKSGSLNDLTDTKNMSSRMSVGEAISKSILANTSIHESNPDSPVAVLKNRQPWKLIPLNQTTRADGDETPNTKFLKKSKLNDSVPVLESMKSNELVDPDIQKKKLKRKSLGFDLEELPEVEYERTDMIVNVLPEKKSKKRKLADMSTVASADDDSMLKNVLKKKQKRIDSASVEETDLNQKQEIIEKGKEKKKKKNKQIEIVDIPKNEVSEEKEKSKKKKKNKKLQEVQINGQVSEVLQSPDEKPKKKKKSLVLEEVPTKIVKSKKKKVRLSDEMKSDQENVSANVKVEKQKKKSAQEPKKKNLETVFNDDDEAPDTLDFAEARRSVLSAIREATKNSKSAKKKRKANVEPFTSQGQVKEKKGLKRLPDDVLENLTDEPLSRPIKRQKLSKNIDRNVVMPSKSMFSPGKVRPKNLHVDDGFIPLSSAGGTTQFGVINLEKAKKIAKKNPAVLNLREKMLSRNMRQPMSAYLSYKMKQKAKSEIR